MQVLTEGQNLTWENRTGNFTSLGFLDSQPASSSQVADNQPDRIE